MTQPATPAPARASRDPEIRIISHSTLFYWWPVWAAGFLMAIISLFGDHRLAVVPDGTQARRGVDIDNTKKDVLVVPEKFHLPINKTTNEPEEPHLHISTNKSLGVVFMTILLIVIFITNVPLRGLWSVIVIVLIISVSIILALLDAWEHIIRYLSILDIRINLGGYLFLSIVLLGMWLVIFLLFDQQIYMVFTPGQLRVRLEIGDAETAYDTSGMTMQKQRSDFFRHWVLGLGSGDLIVRTSGAQSHTFDMPNVLFLGRKVQAIEDMLRSKQVVSGQK